MLHRNFLALVLLLSSVCVAQAVPPSAAPTATAAPAAAPAAAPVATPTPPPLPPKGPRISRLDFACLHPNASSTAISGTSQLTAALSNETVWQPQDGHVKFTITYPNNGSPSPLSALEIRVCFGWPAMVSQSADPATAPTVYAATYVQVLSRDDHSVTYETSMPPGLWQDPGATGFADIWSDLWHRWTGAPRHIYDGWGVVPILNMHVVGMNGGDANAGPNAINVVLPVGLTWRWLAFFITALMTCIAWSCLLRWARHRKVRGGWVIRIISNRNNYASLSQFQIMLWTLVIAAGAVYVMTLTGSLISIPGQALALLGISGFSALSAAVKSQQDAAKPQAGASDDSQTKPTNPSAVRDLRVLGANAATTVVIWRKGKGGTPTVSYSVTLMDAKGVAVDDFKAPLPGNTFFAVKTPPAGSYYQLSVTALDASNNQSAVSGLRIEPNTTAAETDVVPTVQTVGASLPDADNVPVIAWEAGAAADFYLLQYRRAGSADWEMTEAPLTGRGSSTKFRQPVPDLKFQMPYEFQITGVKGGKLGQPSSVATITTGERMPRWSDLVVWDGQHELDITRVQMLVFTVLAAIFVVLKIGDDSAIPQIPDSVILLMGLSNGVYVGGKFVGATR
ncbi:MAG TPA: fibronectin type III domain-containing protein [Rhizomicrobium sp.]|jgi:hypothetical protein